MLALHQQRLDPQHGMRELLTLQLPVLWIQTLLFPSVGDIESESSISTHYAQDVATGGRDQQTKYLPDRDSLLAWTSMDKGQF